MASATPTALFGLWPDSFASGGDRPHLVLSSAAEPAAGWRDGHHIFHNIRSRESLPSSIRPGTPGL
jgi:hypothetical protein